MPLQTIKVENPDGLSMIMGSSPRQQTIEEIHTALIHSIPEIRFGLAFKEQYELITTGTDNELIGLAVRNAENIGAREVFVLFVDQAIPKSVMHAIKPVAAINKIYCATPHPVEVIVTESSQGRGVMGLVDDYASGYSSGAVGFVSS